MLNRAEERERKVREILADAGRLARLLLLVTDVGAILRTLSLRPNSE